MSFDKKSFTDIYDNMVVDTRRRIPELTDFEEGSVIRSLFETFAVELATLYEQLDLVYQAGFIDTAEDANLDRVVAVLGMKRNEPDFATGMVTFERDKGLNDELIIPIGTLVMTEEDESKTPPKKAYITIEEERISPGKTSADVRIQAEERGKQWVADPGSVIVMPRPVAGVKAIHNAKPVRFLGRDRENDAELRQRAKQALLASGRASITSIENALIGMPGVREVRVKEDFPPDGRVDKNAPGLGMVEVYVDGLTNQNAPALRERLDQVRAAGVYVVLKPAIAIHLEAVIQVELDKRIPADEQPKVENDVALAVEGLVTSLGMGQPLLFSQLASEILKVNGVKDVPNFQISTYREDDSDNSRACGKVKLTREATARAVTIPANTLLRTEPGSEFLTITDTILGEGKGTTEVDVRATRSGCAGELARTGAAIGWEKAKIGGINFTASNHSPIKMPRSQYSPAERRIDAQILERMVAESIRVAAGQKALRVRVLVRLPLLRDDAKKQRQTIEDAMQKFFAACQVGKGFTKTELETALRPAAGDGFELRLVSFPFQSQTPEDDYLVEASFVEKPEAEIIFVYCRALRLHGKMQLVLPLTATGEEKSAATGAARQAIKDFLDALAPEEDVDLEKMQETLASVEKVLRIEFRPEDCSLLDEAGQPLNERIKDRAVSVEAFEKVFLADSFEIKA